ncbi:MAG: hypothetical protein ACRDZ1_03700 [Acidimicrobiia bacterium]
MRNRQVVIGGLVGAVGVAGAALLRVLRALPLVEPGVPNDGGSTKKDDKKDFKKKGNGPMTRRKKAKKGKS